MLHPKIRPAAIFSSNPGSLKPDVAARSPTSVLQALFPALFGLVLLAIACEAVRSRRAAFGPFYSASFYFSAGFGAVRGVSNSD
jgi:hypothetical protein